MSNLFDIIQVNIFFYLRGQKDEKIVFIDSSIIINNSNVFFENIDFQINNGRTGAFFISNHSKMSFSVNNVA